MTVGDTKEQQIALPGLIEMLAVPVSTGVGTSPRARVVTVTSGVNSGITATTVDGVTWGEDSLSNKRPSPTSPENTNPVRTTTTAKPAPMNLDARRLLNRLGLSGSRGARPTDLPIGTPALLRAWAVCARNAHATPRKGTAANILLGSSCSARRP